MNNLLPLLILLPLLGGLALLLARRAALSESAGEKLGILIALSSLALSLLLVIKVVGISTPTSVAADPTGGSALPTIIPKLEYAPEWLRVRMPATATLSNDGWQLRLGLDGIGAIMILLTTLVTACVLVVARRTVEHHRSDFGAWILVATGCMLLVFMSMDLLLFYIGFELVLIPLYVLIARWGDRDAAGAAKRFVLYTLAGSLPMVLALLGISALYGSGNDWQIGLSELSLRAATSIGEPDQSKFQLWIFWLLVLGLGIKTAVLPLHTWLPTTYGAAHPTCSAFLAAVVLKLGLFGFVRLVLPLVPEATAIAGPVVLGTLGAVAIVYGAMAALAQRDLRLLMAYSSLSHVGFITLGMFALNVEGIAGATLQMFNHGLTTAAMFLLMACLIARRGSTRWDEGSRGIASHFPRLAFFLVFFVVAGAGMPGLNNFVGELLALIAMISVYPVLTAIGALGILLGAWYAFRLTQNILFGRYDDGKRDDGRRDERKRDTDRRVDTVASLQTADLSFGQKAVFGSLALLSLVIGILPLSAINIFREDVERIAAVTTQASQALDDSRTVSQSPVARLERHVATIPAPR
jgi:NADH-quinone oxidoreductase subunit M